ncbi:DHA2 family multidrug resistance protein-like MFS transporter [Herbaspirillum sp. Sphag1AN]|uniref:MFS transporter n=1 Tax=unclassified Herbaspirillum TaxID=2624150 RepID=UPI00161F913B|nr:MULTISPECIES: MFS transporter [unclassified Herbaspirillum]MBB3214468.1 DHA2 family multidrug resistance protein-like MFS transporter [Herbaspirillum sp. Sphag1AN]MBB3247428.1 DHA2 family multidrug resistance protein-like MFS transporter [Herbaspirillum sp. Sphag64]
MDPTTPSHNAKAHHIVTAGEGLPADKRTLAVVTLSIAVGLATLDTAIANTALPVMAIDLHTTPAASVWIVTAYQLAMMVSLLPLAALGEIVGYRRIYIGGLALFTAASLLCAVSWSLPTLVVARFLQGLGGAGIMSVNSALIRFIYPSKGLGRGVGLNTLIVAIAFTVGPSVASAILAIAPWPWLFAVNVPLGLIGLALAIPSLPFTPNSTHHFDMKTALLNAAAFGLLILAIGEGAHQASANVVGLEFAAALICGVFLLRRQASHPAPMLPVDLFRRPMFALSAVTAVCSFAAQGLAFVSLPFFFHHDLGRTQVEIGLLMTPWPVAVAIMAPIAGRLSDRYPAGILGGVGLALLSIGMLLMAFMPGQPSVFDISWRMLLCGMGFGFFQSPNLKALMTSAPAERSGGASGIVATARLFGQSIGAALVALCFSVSMSHGSRLALGLGAGFAGAACLASFLRLLTNNPAAPRTPR